MEAFWAAIQGFIWVPVVILVLLVIFAYAKFSHKVAKADQALVVTGRKKGVQVYKPGSGAFVPLFRKHAMFPIAVMTVRSNDQETQTKTIVPVVVQWTAQLRADVETVGALEKAVQGFLSQNPQEIAASLQQTLDGEVRAVVATMTPEQVITDKDSFAKQVTDGVQQRMAELGFKLVSLNIAEVFDRNNYYVNLSATDREAQRMAAETTTAQANQHVAVEQARADKVSRSAELDRDLEVAEKNRGVALRQAEIKAETDIATTDADFAGKLRAEERRIELAAREGEVAVVQEQQAQAAAIARRDVEVTNAETQRQRAEIEAEAAANVAKRTAEGQADAAIARAQGEADAINRTTEAKARQVRETGLAEAEVARAKGEAEAAALLAKGNAEAESQRLMAEALAANDGANLEVRLAEIQRDTIITVHTTVGEAMARIGEKATFVDMGGNSGAGGDLLSNVLGNVPELLNKLNVKSGALMGVPFSGALGGMLGAALGKTAPEVQGDAPQEATPAVAAPTPRSEKPAVPVVEPAAPASAPSAPAEAPVELSPQEAAVVDSAVDLAAQAAELVGDRAAKAVRERGRRNS